MSKMNRKVYQLEAIEVIVTMLQAGNALERGDIQAVRSLRQNSDHFHHEHYR